MNLTQIVARIFQPEIYARRSSSGTWTLFTSVGLLVVFGTVANATPLAALHQDRDEAKIEVILQEIGAKSNDEIEAVIVEEIALDDQNPLKKIELKQLKQAVANEDGDIELVVIAGGDSNEHTEVLKRHKGQLRKLLSDDNVKVEVIVTDEAEADGPKLLKKLRSSHDALNSKLHLGSGDHNVFVVRSDSDDDTVLHQHKHLVEILHNQESGKNDLRSLANKLRQLADQLEAMHGTEYSANKSHKRIKVAPKGKNKFHFEKKSGKSKPDQKVMQWKTSAGEKVIVGQPGQAKTMIVEVKPDDDRQHSHSVGKSQKKIVLRGDAHEAHGNLFVEKIELDSKDQDPVDVARKIIGQIKKKSTSPNAVQNIVVEALAADSDKKIDLKKGKSFKWKSSPKEMDSSIQDLRKELKELRRQIKELQADRKND